ncbi:hypothetical protein RHSIM_Rhsim07G0247300 [Rhododendron simsii]|uniref:1-(5-phosphoribosyl)-5-[(5-phosphoribosylamino)methylideneamino] imidazole-4-carboxamide isomerase HISN3, chloroplastic n=1 Tax=Rhododendron simsii TaxID=118357 RepID=A0A834LKD2_RHOSS|nr:hypothetical protein RHSIM_Rhsim07G0247300 [Rhododendron simsii]
MRVHSVQASFSAIYIGNNNNNHQKYLGTVPSSISRPPRGLCIQSGVRFRPCIDIHKFHKLNVGHAQLPADSWVFDKVARHQVNVNWLFHLVVLLEGSVNCHVMALWTYSFGQIMETCRTYLIDRVCFQGKVKQIVGSTIQDLKEGSTSPVTNFESDKSAAEYAIIYKEDGLTGGHVIMIGADPLSKSAAMEALHAFPGGLHVGGGINPDNALSYIEEGASHVIITSNVFNNGQLELQRLEELACVVGKQRLVLDLSCRKKEGKYAIVTDRWRKFTYVFLDEKIMDFLATYADEFLVHGVDVEGKRYWCEESGKLRERNDVAFEVLAERKKWTRCPHCHHCVERVDGCSIVKCRCGSSFCYKWGRRKVHRQPLYLPL